MNKKIICLASLLAIMAVAMPAAAQAIGSNGSPTAWKLNGKKSAVGTPIPVIAWGTLELVSAAGTIKCRNAAYSLNTNTATPEARSEVVMFSTFECKASGGECTAPAEERATAFNLTPDASPNKGVWSSENVEEGPVEAEETFRALDLSTGANKPIEVNIECYAAGEKVGSLLFVSGPLKAFPKTGSSTPALINGTSAVKPSETSFDANSGHLFAETEAELVPEEVVEPTVKITAGSPTIEDEGKTWSAIIKPGCRVKSAALFPNEVVKEVISPTKISLENKVNPGKNFGLATGTFPVKFNCGALSPVPIEGTTKGKVKFVGYLDNAPTPLVTIGPKSAP